MPEHQDTVAEASYFDDVADHRTFDEFSEAQYREILELMLGGLPASARVLDAGCGSGAWLAAVNRMGFPAVGVELSPALAQQGRDAGLDVVIGDLLDPPDLGEFDAVLLCGVLHHFPSHDERVAVLQSVSRMLKPGGIVASIDPNGSNPFVRMAFHMHLEVSPNECCLSERDIAAACRDAGLDVASTKKMNVFQPRSPGGPLQKVWPLLRRVALFASPVFGRASRGNYTVVLSGCGARD